MSYELPLVKDNLNEHREVYFEKIKGLLENISQEINQEQDQKILNPNCTIEMQSFIRGNKGPYQEKWVNGDLDSVRNYELAHSYAYEEPEENREQLIQEYREKQQKSNGALLEAAKTILFHKAIKSDFLVMRSSNFDDYENGVDNVMVNKKTGDIICAFDEVNDKKDGKFCQKKRIKLLLKEDILRLNMVLLLKISN